MSGVAADPSLQRALDALAPPGVLIGHRVIQESDAAALHPEEARAIPSSIAEKQRASGAARIVARALLARLGHDAMAVPRDASGAPVWPADVIGSLAHDDDVAVAAIALQKDVAALGIDVEPAAPLPADMIDLVVTAPERPQLDANSLNGRVLFAAKEAVYKAAYPLDRQFLEFHDIAVDLDGATAQTRTGRTFALRICVAPRIVVLARA